MMHSWLRESSRSTLGTIPPYHPTLGPMDEQEHMQAIADDMGITLMDAYELEELFVKRWRWRLLRSWPLWLIVALALLSGMTIGMKL